MAARKKKSKPVSPALSLAQGSADRWMPYVVLVIAVFAAYGNVYDNAFLYDDESLILKNAFLRSWGGIASIFSRSITAGANIPGGFYRPLQITLYLIVYQLFGPAQAIFHLLNVSLHAANACLVFLLGRKLRFRTLAVFLGTLLWALHPMHVEVIGYIGGLADPLYTFFILLGLIILLPSFKPRSIYIAAGFMVLALLSKEEAVTFPLLVMACIFSLDKDRFEPKTYLRAWPFWVISICYVLFHKFALSFGDFNLHSQNDEYAKHVLVRLWTFLAALPSYLGFIVWPVHLHFDRDFPAVLKPWHLSVLLGFLMVAAGALQVIFGRKRRALMLSWGLLWFAAADVLHTGLLVPVNAVLLEHWLYVPSIGLFLGAAQAVATTRIRLERRKPVEASIAAIAAVLLGFLTYKQNMIWHNAETLYLNIFKNGEPSPHAHNNLAIVYTLDGRYKEALEQYDLAIDLSGDTNAQAHHNLAITLLNGPDGQQYTQEAIRNLRRAIEIDPDYYPSVNALAVMYDMVGDQENAALYRQKADALYTKLTGNPPPTYPAGDEPQGN